MFFKLLTAAVIGAFAYALHGFSGESAVIYIPALPFIGAVAYVLLKPE